MLQHGRNDICGVSLAWVTVCTSNDKWISCKELRDRRLHQSDVEKRALDLNLRVRQADESESSLLRKLGAGSTHRFGPLLHADDVYIIIESCEKFPLLQALIHPKIRKRPKFRRKRQNKNANDKKEEEVIKSEQTPPDSIDQIGPQNDILMARIHQEIPENFSPRKKRGRKKKPDKLSEQLHIIDPNQDNLTPSEPLIPKPTPEQIHCSDLLIADEKPPEKFDKTQGSSTFQKIEKTPESAILEKMAKTLESAIYEKMAKNQELATFEENKKICPIEKIQELVTIQEKYMVKPESKDVTAITDSDLKSAPEPITIPAFIKKPRTMTERPKRIRTGILKAPHMTISKNGIINFTAELQKQAGLIKSDREIKRQEKELESLTKEAERILIEDETFREEEEKRLKRVQAENEKNALKSAVNNAKQQKETEKLEKKAKLLSEKLNKMTKRQLAKSAASPEKPVAELKSPKRPRRNSLKTAQVAALTQVAPPLKSPRKSRDGKSLTVRRKSNTKTSQKPMPPPEAPAPPAPIMGCVTFRSGDKLIRRSPRKLPEAAVNAANPKTGVIPYAFAALLGNTHGAIPHGLSERHFVRNRPAMKRATPSWFDTLDEDSGLDSAEELALRNLFTESKKDAELIALEVLKEDLTMKKKTEKKVENGSSSGDSGRETPTSQEVKPFSLKSMMPESYGAAEVINVLDMQELCIQSFNLGRNDPNSI